MSFIPERARVNIRINTNRSAAELTRDNPILARGELASPHDDASVLKRGDGRTRWADLPAIGGAGGSTNATTLGGQPGSYYRDRANHTGTQLAATISDLDTYLYGHLLAS
jgi:hypothetical protein